MSVLISLIAFLFVIGILVFIHELGHFLLAKWSGVRVEKFSLGFGKKIFSFKRGETEYLLSMLPLGGYVKMYGEGGEGNFVVEDVVQGSKAEEAGFKSGDRILDVEGIKLDNTSSWKKLEFELLKDTNREYIFSIERDDNKNEIKTDINGLEGLNAFSEKEYARSFANQPIINRLLIVVAGPSMNFLLPFLFLPIVFMMGISIPAYLEDEPKIGYIEPGSPSEKAGFNINDIIIEIDNKRVDNWRDVNISLQTKPDVLLDVKVLRNCEDGKDGGVCEEKDLKVIAATTSQGVVSIGLAEPISAKIGGVLPGSPAAKAGLKDLDTILEIDGEKINNWDNMASIIRTKSNTEITLLVERAGDIFKTNITPEPNQDGNGAIGIRLYVEEITKKYGFFDSIINGIKEAAQMIIEVTVLLFTFLYNLITGKIALGTAGKSLAGPLLIAKVSGAAAESGFPQLLQFTAFISINLAIINLFPIPVLDGGHVVYLTIEAIKRKPLSQKTLELTQKVGFTFLIFIMFLAIYNDIARLKGDIIGSIYKVFDVFK